ncbi:pyridoxal phosphate-dependent transferase [Aspergillus crustosus]
MSPPPPLPPIDLSSGFPAPSLNPIPQLNNATNTVFSRPDIWHNGMIYGPDAGYEPLRENIAAWLSEFYYRHRDSTVVDSGNAINADRICITGGASQNLACLLQVFTDPVVTRNVFVVEPAYFLSFRVFEDAGFHGRLRGVPEDEEGVDLGFLKEMLEMLERDGNSTEDQKPFKPPRPYRKLYRHVIYCVPTFSNPSGRIMSLARRRELVRLARKHDALIIADDVYDFVNWQADPSSNTSAPPDSAFTAILPRLVDIDRTLDGGPINSFGNCVSNGSFSKLVGPGCRVGWAEGTPAFAYGLSQAGSSRSGGAPSHLMSTFINEMLHSPPGVHKPTALTTHIQHTLIPAYSRRYTILLAAILNHLVPLGISLPPSNKFNLSGGFFLWLELPDPLRSHDVVKAAREDGVIVGNGAVSALPEGNDRRAKYEGFIRLCLAWADEERLEEGMRVLAGSVRRLLDGTGAGLEQAVAKI